MLKIKLFLCALLFLSACQTESNPLPIPTVEPSVNAENARVNMQVLVLDADANPLSGAEVVLKSTDDEQKASTATSGMTSFLDLSRSKTYQIEVSALGFKATSRSVHLESLTEAEQKDLIVSLKLEPAGKVILGKVIANGAPLEEVVVFDGSMSTTTNSEGEFSLAYAKTPPTQLSFKRQGYQKQTQVVSTNGGQVDLGVVSLSSDPSARQAILDLRHSSLGLDGILSQAKMARLMQNIRDQGYQLQVLTEPSDSPLTGDLLILPSPSLALSVEEISAIQAYVIQGGKLLFTGEWEGFGG